MKPIATAHIWLDDEGRAWIDNTNIKVIEVALDRIAYGWSAEEIHYQHYDYLSLAQIHAGLSYYFHNQAQFDQEIERQVAEVDALREAQKDSPLMRKLSAARKVS